MAAAVVPAAGRSERFGSMKLLADVGGEPLLDRTLAALIQAGLSPVIVVLAPAATLEPAVRLRHPAVSRIVNPDPSRGMFSSIQCGLAQAPPGTTLVLPADMPFVRSDTISRVAERAGDLDRVVIPVWRGRRGHPVAIPARLIAPLLAANPAQSLKEALTLQGEGPMLLEVDDEGVVRDVDRQEDLYRGI